MSLPLTDAGATMFADPYKKCPTCGQWVDGADSSMPGPLVLIPCRHTGGYVDVCPSWGPVDGCTCADYNARCVGNPGFQPIVHDMRTPTPGDGKVY